MIKSTHRLGYQRRNFDRRIGQLAKSGVSDNVGGVKAFSSILRHALRKERHFALVEKGAGPTKGWHRNRFRSGTRSDPFVSSVATPIMITNSDSPLKIIRSGLFGERRREARSVSIRGCAPHRKPALEPESLTSRSAYWNGTQIGEKRCRKKRHPKTRMRQTANRYSASDCNT